MKQRSKQRSLGVALTWLTRATSAAALLLLPVAPAAAQGVEYYHLDAMGNVRAVTNQSQQVIERHDYLPFGEEWNPAGGPQPLRFTGKERDAETGLDYFGARYYGSRIGRFTTVDPALEQQRALADSQRWNRYAYANNNPFRYVDPDGRSPKLVTSAIKIAVKGGDVYSTVSGIVDATGTIFSTDPAVGTGTRILATGSLIAEISGAADVVSGVRAIARIDDAANAAKARNVLGGPDLGAPGGPKPGSAGGPGTGRRPTAKERAEALAENEGNCVFCGGPAKEAEHAIPACRGGDCTTGPSGNLQPSCVACNRGPGGKHTQTSEEFLRRKQGEK
jgi:RHS repeat-associated protein